ncbi:Ribonuclease H [Daldinia childiae]|uniref:Ribonuclease H n=1 Tax=Daldinia childiae TaxID=326645 RepID=UPI0014472EE7|nr:Ribonuclease H [Daldinia childiae]KAF3070501.1 Ribonuclease H [Daldinia childiae]
MPINSTKKGQASKSASQPANTTPAKTSRKRKMDADSQKYYAVRAGVNPGVYLTWAECQEQTAGFRGASYKSFLSKEDAEAYVAGKKTSAAAPGEERFYAVAVGREPGVYTDWDTASLAIKGWKGPKYKRFDTREGAIEYIRTHGNEAAQEALLKDEGGEPSSKKRKKSAGSDANKLEDEKDVLRVYTDGSSLANGRVGAAAGVGVFFGHGDERNISERLQGEIQTNQRAELTAILRALETVPVEQKIRIFSDSKYSISCATEWYVNWQKNGWRTKDGPVKNKDLVEAIRAKIDERTEAGTKTFFQWVKGHAADAGNVAADELAVNGARQMI